MPSLGILGGSFNPPHAGHLALAREARRELGLDRVLLMPLHTPPHKPGGEDPGPGHRLAMTRLAAEGHEGIEVSPLEVERGGTSYTADSLRTIHGLDPDADLTFIVGADTALTLPGWREPGAVLGLARIAVAGRPDADRERVLAAVRGIPREQAGGPEGAEPADPEIVFLSMAPVAASSTEARRRIAAGEPLEGMLAPAVERYIDRHGLYRDGEHP